MIGHYGLSVIGTSHATQVGGACQDAHAIRRLPEGWVVAAIADGVGSASQSATGARIASVVAVQTVEERCPPLWDAHVMSDVVEHAFHEALRGVLREAEREGLPASEYDTTLTVVVYNGEHVVCGHVGDSGVVALKPTGDFARITEAQKGEEHNTVVPLRAGPGSWVFRALSEPVCGLLMMTDGILDVACPWILARTEQPVFVGYVRPFIDANVMKARSDAEFKQLEDEIAEFLSGDRSRLISDDKTVVGLVNTEIVPEVKAVEYYEDPDWAELRRAHDQMLYGTGESPGPEAVISDEASGETTAICVGSSDSTDGVANEGVAAESSPRKKVNLARRVWNSLFRWRRKRRHVDAGDGQ